MENLRIHRLHDDVVMPELGTKWSSCFDLRAYLKAGTKVKAWGPTSAQVEIEVGDNGALELYPHHRALIPTGLIFDLYQNQSIRAHPRSGTSIKQGLSLINCEGVIDADYVNETFITLWNTTDVSVMISHGERYAQAEIFKRDYTSINFMDVTKPEQKTDRDGGLGSTGVK